MPMPSRLAQLRSDAKVTLGCLVVSGLIIGSLVAQKVTATQSDRQAQQQQQVQRQQAEQLQQQQQNQLQQAQERARLEALADAQRRMAIEANAQGWRRWQAHIEPKCSVTIAKLDRNRSYLGATISKTRLVYEGLIVCDRNYVGILKGADLKPMWMVPRIGSGYPMPSDPPPPEFRSPIPSQTIESTSL
jgi:hypothetical protein